MRRESFSFLSPFETRFYTIFASNTLIFNPLEAVLNTSRVGKQFLKHRGIPYCRVDRVYFFILAPHVVRLFFSGYPLPVKHSR
jgi:hypothetical protein